MPNFTLSNLLGLSTNNPPPQPQPNLDNIPDEIPIRDRNPVREQNQRRFSKHRSPQHIDPSPNHTFSESNVSQFGEVTDSDSGSVLSCIPLTVDPTYPTPRSSSSSSFDTVIQRPGATVTEDPLSPPETFRTFTVTPQVRNQSNPRRIRFEDQEDNMNNGEMGNEQSNIGNRPGHPPPPPPTNGQPQNAFPNVNAYMIGGNRAPQAHSTANRVPAAQPTLRQQQQNQQGTSQGTAYQNPFGFFNQPQVPENRAPGHERAQQQNQQQQQQQQRQQNQGNGNGQGQAQPAPNVSHAPAMPYFTNINVEMPKYTMPLSRLALRLFIQRFTRWTQAKGMSEQQSKLALPLAFVNPTAQNYFMIHYRDQEDDNINWEEFVTKFMRDCPMEEDDARSILDILGRKQAELEKASVYVQKIRAMVSEEYSKYAEPDVIRLMMEGLNPALRQYLECRGPPTSYHELLTMIKHYEERGLDKTWNSYPVTPMPQANLPAYHPTNTNQVMENLPINMVNTTNADVQALAETVKELTAEIYKLTATRQDNHSSNDGRRRNNNQNARNGPENEENNGPRQNRGYNNGGQQRTPFCRYHNRSGHWTSDCRDLRRDRDGARGYRERDRDDRRQYGRRNDNRYDDRRNDHRRYDDRRNDERRYDDRRQISRRYDRRDSDIEEEERPRNRRQNDRNNDQQNERCRQNNRPANPDSEYESENEAGRAD